MPCTTASGNGVYAWALDEKGALRVYRPAFSCIAERAEVASGVAYGDSDTLEVLCRPLLGGKGPWTCSIQARLANMLGSVSDRQLDFKMV